jgi:hypothetical protein
MKFQYRDPSLTFVAKFSNKFPTPMLNDVASDQIRRQPTSAANINKTDELSRRSSITDGAPPICKPAVAVGGRTVVEPSPTPDGPMETVFPLITVVSVGAPEPMRKVDEPITTSVASTEKLTPSTVTADSNGAAVTLAGGIVDEARPTPPAPNETVLPLTVINVWDAPWPIR